MDTPDFTEVIMYSNYKSFESVALDSTVVIPVRLVDEVGTISVAVGDA